jgi:hypothetical protein
MEIPGVGPAIERVAAMRAHFWEQEPKILTAVWGLFRHWREFKPYWTLALIVAATVVIEGVIAYKANTEYIGWVQGGRIVGLTALLAGVVVLVNLVPITALSFHYSLSGKRTRLKFMTVGALVATIFGFNFLSLIPGTGEAEGSKASLISQWRIEERMKDPKFRHELQGKLDMFLWYYHDLLGETLSAEEWEDLNQEFRAVLSGLAPNDEPSAFEILDRGPWLGVIYYHSDATCNLDKPAGAGAVDAENAAVLPGYSLLAVAFKNTEDVRRVTLQQVQERPDYEELDPLEVVDYVNSASILYEWDEALDDLVANTDCRSLLHDRGS